MIEPVQAEPHRRRWGRWIAMSATLGLLGACHPTERAEVRLLHTVAYQPSRAPNVLIIIADDHAGGTLGIDGDPHKATPHLDQLAREGVRFDRAYCNAPVCTPSRQSLVTGRLPHSTGVTRLATALSNQELTLGEWFGELGYSTAAIGKMHFNHPGAKHGFQSRLDLEEYEKFLKTRLPKKEDHRADWHALKGPPRSWLNADVRPHNLPHELMDSAYFVNQASAYFDKAKSSTTPFLMVVGLYEPHAPFKFPNDWKRVYRPRDFTVPAVSGADLLEQPEIFRDLKPIDFLGIQAAYYTAISYLDFEVGRLMAALDGAGLADDTIVVYLGDNGYMRGDHGRVEKHCHYEPAVRIPLIFRWKGHLPANKRVEELVELVDLFPTLVDFCGLKPPEGLHGKSLLNLLVDPATGKGDDFVFSEYLEDEEAMVRDRRYKLIVGTGRRKRLDGYQTGRPLPGPYQKLFDLQADPGEARNQVDNPELARVHETLLDLLHKRITTTRRPNDQVPSTLNRLDAIHWCLRPRD